jgi:hypothetical protein
MPLAENVERYLRDRPKRQMLDMTDVLAYVKSFLVL